jgi:putative transposase
MRLLDEQYTRTPFYEIQKMTAWLHTQGYEVNHKRVARLLRLMGLMAVYPALRLSQPAEQAVRYPYLLRGLSIERVNQVWSTDITYIRLARGFLYLMAIMDWFSRYVLAWRTSITLETAFCLEALEQAFERARPEIFNNDQGSQFTSTAFTSRLQAAGVRISWMAAAEHWIIFSSNGCADAHSFSLLEESNITEAEVIKALPYLAGKPKGDRSMERKRSAGGTRSQEAVRARPYRVSPELLRTSGDSLQVNNQRVMVLVPLLEIRVISRSSC